jgi:hypothetical protein
MPLGPWILLFMSLGTAAPPTTATSFTGIASEADCIAMRKTFIEQAGPQLAKKLRGICITLPTAKGSIK